MMNDSGLQREIAAISTEAMDLGMAMDELATFVRSHPVDHSATAWMIRKGAEEFKRLSSRLGSLSPETPSTDSQVLPPLIPSVHPGSMEDDWSRPLERSVWSVS